MSGTHYPYGFNGKEENEELGLQWVDFEARNYDPALGRWMNLDPLATMGGKLQKIVNDTIIILKTVLYHLHFKFSQLKRAFCALASIKKITVGPATPIF